MSNNNGTAPSPQQPPGPSPERHLQRQVQVIKNRLSIQLRRCFCLAAIHRGLGRQVMSVMDDDAPTGSGSVTVEMEETNGLEVAQLLRPLDMAFLAAATSRATSSEPTNLALRVYVGTALDACSPCVLDTLAITHIINATFEYENVWEERVLEDVLFAGLLDKEGSNGTSINWNMLATTTTPAALYLEAAAYRDGRTFPLTYLRVPVRDHVEEDLLSHVSSVVKFIAEAASSCGTGMMQHQRAPVVLFHCKAGVSRSVSLAIAWAMVAGGLTLTEAYRLVKKARPVVWTHREACFILSPNRHTTQPPSQANPNPGFLAQLKRLHRQLFPDESEEEFKRRTSIRGTGGDTLSPKVKDCSNDSADTP